MAANEEDYLDGLLKSLSDKENAESELKDEEEEEIKEQVREAVEKSNETNSQYENIYVDDQAENDEKQAKEEKVEEVLKDVMTVPREMAAPGVDEAFIMDEPEQEKSEPEKQQITPEEVAKLAKEKENAEAVDESVKESEADKALDKLLDETGEEETAGSSLSKDDELVKDMDLSDGEKDRLVNMNLDDLISDINGDAADTDTSGADAVNDLLAQMGMENDDDDSSSTSDKEAGNTEPEAGTGKAAAKVEDSAADINAAQTGGSAANGDVKKQLEDELKSVDKKKKKKGLLSIIKDIFFESLEDETNEVTDEAKASGKEAKAAAKAAKKAAKAEKSKKNNKKEAAAGADTGSNGTGAEAKDKDENEQLIEEVFHGKETLDEDAAPKKGLIAKIKYRIQQFKAKQAKEGEAEEQQEEAERQEKQQKTEAKKAQAKEKKKKAAAEKAAKKEQAKKAKADKPKKEKKPPKPGDIIRFKPKSIVIFVLLIVSVIALIQVFSYAMNYSSRISNAKDYYSNEEYDKAYNSLSGVKLSGSEETIYNQARVIMYVQRQYESYENYEKMNMHTQALNALVKGVDRYQTYRDEAKDLGVEDKMTEAYNLIINAFKNRFKMSETDAIALVELSKRDFTNYYLKIEAYGEAIK